MEPWSDDPLHLRHASGKISQYSTGPHRKLALNNPMAPSQLSEVRIRASFLLNSITMRALTDEGKEVAIEAHVQLAGGNDGDL